MVNILRYIKNCGELRSGEIYMYLVGATSLVIIVNLLLLPLNKSQTIIIVITLLVQDHWQFTEILPHNKAETIVES